VVVVETVAGAPVVVGATLVEVVVIVAPTVVDDMPGASSPTTSSVPAPQAPTAAATTSAPRSAPARRPRHHTHRTVTVDHAPPGPASHLGPGPDPPEDGTLGSASREGQHT
jgi:hypothetical protein